MTRKPSNLISCTHSRPEGVGAFVGRHGAMKPEGKACGRGGMLARLRRPPGRVHQPAALLGAAPKRQSPGSRGQPGLAAWTALGGWGRWGSGGRRNSSYFRKRQTSPTPAPLILLAYCAAIRPHSVRTSEPWWKQQPRFEVDPVVACLAP